MPKLFLFDLDDTLINNNHRKHHVFDVEGSIGEPLRKHDNPDWDTFHSYDLMLQDTCREWTKGLWNKGKFLYGEHAIVTARDKRCAEATLASAFKLDLIDENTTVTMKGVRSGEPSNFYKARIALSVLDNYPEHDIIFVEDMPDIVATLRRLEHPRLTVVDAGLSDSEIRAIIDDLGEEPADKIARLEAKVAKLQSLLPTPLERAALKQSIACSYEYKSSTKANVYLERLFRYLSQEMEASPDCDAGF